MKKQRKILILSTIVSFILLIIVWTQEINGHILNIQAYLDLKIFLVLFWLSIGLLFILILISDTGFLKLGALLGLFTSVLVLIISLAINNTQFESMKSDTHKLVLEIIDESTYYELRVYEKENLFFSEIVKSTTVPKYYDFSYEIVGDKFIITKCGTSTCNTEEIELNN
jgi:ABC-type transport system involved in multi-copper enzyme maturation permease subunit